MKADPFACRELQCRSLETAALVDCAAKRCPFTWQRGSVEDQAERDRKDAMEAGRILTVDNGGSE